MARRLTSANPEPVDVAVGARIRLKRRQMRQSQTHLGQALGVSFQQVQKYERGTNRVSASVLVKVAVALETTVAALVGEDGREPTAPIALVEMTTPGAVALLAAYAAIRDGEARRALITVTRAAGQPQ